MATVLQTPESPAPPENAEGKAKRLKTERRYEAGDVVMDLRDTPFSEHHDSSQPFLANIKGVLYMNTAQQKLDDEIARYREQSRGLGPFDAIAPPPNAMLLGGVYPERITDAKRPRFIQLCNYALEHYNAENQNAKFEFVDLVKINGQVVNGKIYYITFEAKDAADQHSSASRTFQAHVWDKMRNIVEPEVYFCRIKPT